MTWKRADIAARIANVSDRFGLVPQQRTQLRDLLRQSSSDEIAHGLLAVFQDPSRSRVFIEQSYAGELLWALRPPCPYDLAEVLSATLPHWNLSVKELPFYLAHAHGLDTIRDLLAEWLHARSLTPEERRAAETMLHWLRAYPPAGEPTPPA